MSNPTTCAATRNAIGLQGAGSGPSPLASPGGPTTDLFGLPPAPVSRGPSRARATEKPIQGISGPTFFGSPVPPGRLSSWESRLRARLASVGSTECALLWKGSATPAGRSISRLAPSTPLTSAAASIGARWPTPTVSLSTAENPQKFAARNAHRIERGIRPCGENLPTLMATSMWSTATVNDAKNNGAPSQFERHTHALNVQLVGMGRGGPGPSWSTATTASGGVPNPTFPFWLMGFPAEWASGALRATLSSRL